MALVLASKETYPHAEERRLMYVAITRAREKALLVSNPGRPSAFCEELLSKPEEVFQRGLLSDGIPKCPTCGTGRIVPATTTTAYRCSNHPVCKFRAAICPACDEAPLHRVIDEEAKACAICADPECGNKEQVCQNPKCLGGVLLMRSGRHGDFLSCHLFSTTGCKGKAR